MPNLEPTVTINGSGDATLPDGSIITAANGGLYLTYLSARGFVLRRPEADGPASALFDTCLSLFGAINARNFPLAVGTVPPLLNSIVHALNLSGASGADDLPGFSYEGAADAGNALAEVLVTSPAARDFNRVVGRVDPDRLKRNSQTAGLALRWIHICEDAAAFGRRALSEPARDIAESIGKCIKFVMPISEDDLGMTDQVRDTITYYYDRFQKARDSKRVTKKAATDAQTGAEGRVSAARAEGREQARADLTDALTRIMSTAEGATTLVGNK